MKNIDDVHPSSIHSSTDWVYTQFKLSVKLNPWCTSNSSVHTDTAGRWNRLINEIFSGSGLTILPFTKFSVTFQGGLTLKPWRWEPQAQPNPTPVHLPVPVSPLETFPGLRGRQSFCPIVTWCLDVDGLEWMESMHLPLNKWCFTCGCWYTCMLLHFNDFLSSLTNLLKATCTSSLTCIIARLGPDHVQWEWPAFPARNKRHWEKWKLDNSLVYSLLCHGWPSAGNQSTESKEHGFLLTYSNAKSTRHYCFMPCASHCQAQHK